MGIITLVYEFEDTAPATTTNQSVVFKLPNEVGENTIFLKSYETVFNGPAHGCVNATMSSPRFDGWHIHMARQAHATRTALDSNVMSNSLDLRWDGVSQRVGGDVHLLVGKGNAQDGVGFVVNLSWTRDDTIEYLDGQAASAGDHAVVPAGDNSRRPMYFKLVLEYNMEEFL